ncbi:NAD(P)-dependent oxidoreductase [Cohaesibacter celericrescens]|uniref:NAD(P)-dependent oxidoreductase n=1 Tax=Cohaesibacter celericrescens TaxID=2067669 RepID=A0A2N5XVQ2_9HYPH|nr:NAD(P)-dependent oxidoreductase [Cohaesibacter celericrescens]PLW78586.1 NAD(P)-dependent oxidoreductase [Cohaesibacter celericrescens]
MAKIGFMGLGLMGSGMAASLVKAGHDVTVWNRSQGSKCTEIEKLGAKLAPTPEGAAKDADMVISMVADDIASERVWMAEDGALSAAKPGMIAVECSTISHTHVRRLAEEVSKKGAIYIDCPVNGPPADAATGNLVLLVGADPEDLEKARPILEVISKSILHFGAVGTGTGFKLLNNMLGAVHVAAIAEVSHLAQKLELNAETLIAAVESGPCASPHTVRMIRAMAHNKLSEQTGLAIGLREKDTRYCMAMAEANMTGLSIGKAAYGWYKEALSSVAKEDDSAMLQVIAANNGFVPEQ